jgi:hypothetical protein
LAQRRIANVVRIIRSDTTRDAVEASLPAHTIGDGMVRTGAIATHPQAADDLPILVQRDPAAERDDATRDRADPGPTGIKAWVERVRVIEPIQRPTRLGRRVQIRCRPCNPLGSFLSDEQVWVSFRLSLLY